MIKELLNLFQIYIETDSLEFEAHISLLIEILFQVFTEGKNADSIILLYGLNFHEVLSNLRTKMQTLYDNTETDPVFKDFFSKFDSLINLLSPIKIFSESKDMKPLMLYINDCLFNNIQKYNLNEKPVNEDFLKDENIKDYVKGLKLNILNYNNSDPDFLDNIRKKNSLINELFVAVKIINLSVITLFNYIIKKLLFILQLFFIKLLHFFKFIFILI